MTWQFKRNMHVGIDSDLQMDSSDQQHQGPFSQS